MYFNIKYEIKLKSLITDRCLNTTHFYKTHSKHLNSSISKAQYKTLPQKNKPI